MSANHLITKPENTLFRSGSGLPGGAPYSLRGLATLRRWHRNQDIVAQDCGQQNIFCIISGAARQTLVRQDGRRQIADILLAGDFFGFEENGRHGLAVQAMTEDTITASFPRGEVDVLVEENREVAKEIMVWALDTIGRLHEQMLLVSTMTATEKVHRFVQYLYGRLPVRDGRIALPLSRYDMADQLGISAETVSRALTSLQRAGVIEMDGPRTVQLLQGARPEWHG